MDGTRRTELASFLRSRRAAVAPADVGLPVGARRRITGLRREEVAVLADVSVSWYTFLEQGRPIAMSSDALQRVADALRLGEAETRHLFLLAERPPPGRVTSEEVPAPLAKLLFSLEGPAWLVNPRYDVLAWNAASAIWLDLATVAAADRNLVWLVLAHPTPSTVHVDWEGDARRMLAALRSRLAEHRDDPRFAELIGRLMGESAFFREWWPRQEVTYSPSLTMGIRNEALGLLEFSATALRPEVAPHLRLMVWTPEPATRAALTRSSRSGTIRAGRSLGSAASAGGA